MFMFYVRAAAIGLCLPVFASLALAQQQDDCARLEGQSAIDACTRDINSGRLGGRKLARAYLNRGLAKESFSDFDGAFADYDQAIRIDRNYAYAYANRGDIYQRRGEPTRAFEDFSTAIRLEPNNSDNLNARCWMLVRGNLDLKQALADCDRSIQMRANQWNYHFNRGFVHFRLGNYDRAISDLDATLRIRSYAPASYLRGLAKLKTGDTTGGENDIATARNQYSRVEEEYESYGIRR